MAVSWSIALASAVVLAPADARLGAVAVALAVPCLALALVLRPAVVALALTCALLGIGRAELPAADAQLPARAAALAGQVATLSARVTDDPRPSGGGSELLVQPDSITLPGSATPAIGGVLIRWRGPTEASFGDEVQATGKLTLPRDLPTFDRRAYLAQHHVYLELQATALDVVDTGSPVTAIPAWLRARFRAAIESAVTAPHAAVLLGIVLGIREGIPPALQQALIA
ncbi:MAG TPA: DUF4131 domain-containing protein, partial [Solirubrobacteraceae bacterium]